MSTRLTRYATLAALALGTLGLAACDGGDDPSKPGAQGGPNANGDPAAPGEPVDPKAETVRSSLARDVSPKLTDAEAAAFATSQADAAISLYRVVAAGEPGKNVFLSPHSISIALAMTYAGARGDTATEMQKALRYDLPGDRLHTAFDYLDLEFARRGQGVSAEKGDGFRLSVANSIWAQKDYPFASAYLDTLAVNYGVGLNVVDFIGATEPSRLKINAWVEDKTERRITDLLAQGVIKTNTRMVLVNAVYFKASWASAFQDGATSAAAFTGLDGSSLQVPTMHGVSYRPYVNEDGLDAIALPYVGNELSMLVLAPPVGTFDSFEASLTSAKVLDLFARLRPTDIDLGFPKLKVEASFKMRDALMTLGMKTAFDPDHADLTGMVRPDASPDQKKLYVDNVVHKTFLAVDEKGTEAAAATAVIVGGPTSMPPPPRKVAIDRPFIVAIVDQATKTLLFLGRIVAPNGG